MNVIDELQEEAILIANSDASWKSLISSLIIHLRTSPIPISEYRLIRKYVELKRNRRLMLYSSNVNGPRDEQILEVRSKITEIEVTKLSHLSRTEIKNLRRKGY